MDKQDDNDDAGGEEIRNYIQKENESVYMLDNQMVEYLLKLLLLLK